MEPVLEVKNLWKFISNEVNSIYVSITIFFILKRLFVVLFKYFKSPDSMLEIDNVFSLVFCDLLILDNVSVHCDNGVS